MLTQVTWRRVTQRLLSLADSLSKNGSLLLDGHCTFPPFCWSPGQSFSKENGGTVAWMSRSSALISTSISICKMHHAHPLVCLWCQCATPLRSGFHAESIWKHLPWSGSKTAWLLYHVQHINQCPVCHKWQLCCDLWELPEGDTQKPYLSKKCQIMVLGYSCPLSRCVTLGRLGQIHLGF